MCVEQRIRKLIIRDMIDIMLWLDDQASSSDRFGWTTSCPTHGDWMIIGFFTGYHIREYRQTDNCAFGNCARGPRGNGSGKFTGMPYMLIVL
jgi:hypothetical protein